jgi:hypothetical protein
VLKGARKAFSNDWVIVILLKNPKNASTRLSMNGKSCNDFKRISVRPEALEG